MIKKTKKYVTNLSACLCLENSTLAGLEHDKQSIIYIYNIYTQTYTSNRSVYINHIFLLFTTLQKKMASLVVGPSGSNETNSKTTTTTKQTSVVIEMKLRDDELNESIYMFLTRFISCNN